MMGIDTTIPIIEQIRWERDTAIAQLSQIGKGLGERMDDIAEVMRCKDCKHFHYDMPYVIQGIPVLGHEVCDFWGDGCKTSENGFCSYAERRTDGQT